MNAKIEIIAYEPKHSFEILVRPHDEKNVKNKEEFKTWAEANAHGAAFTARRISDGKIIACAGVRILWPGCGEAWAIFCNEIHRHKIEIHKNITAYLKIIINDFKLRRIQAYVRADVPVAVDYIEHMGFEREGLLRKFGLDGEDQYIYAMILEG